MSLPSILIPNKATIVILPSGKNIKLPTCSPQFNLWEGKKIDFDYGNKPVIDYKNNPVFAELAILRIFLENGWSGVWVETYGGINFLREMPHDWKLSPHNVKIPNEKRELISKIQKIAKTTACFDVFVWKDDQLLFCEAKNKGKDKLTSGQIKFIEGALSYGILPKQLLIVEWEICL